MTCKSIFAIIFSVVISKCNGFSTTDINSQNEFIVESKLTILAIDNALSYIQGHPQALKVDVIFGVLIARANLQWISNRLQSTNGTDFFWWKEVLKLTRKCNEIATLNKNQDSPFTDLRLWENEAQNLVSGTLNQGNGVFTLPKFDTCSSIIAYMLRGTPRDSNLCINELFKSHCKISDYCWYSEMNGQYHSGYRTTHRLIYLQFAGKLKCETVNPQEFSEITEKKKKLCQQILLEAMSLHAEPNFLLTRDLFMEQIALCGLEGYEEFAPKTWRKEIRNWQSPEGCFGQDMSFSCSNFTRTERNSKKRVKRSDFVINNCHTHVTAVALSSMAFHLRFLLKKTIFLTQEH